MVSPDGHAELYLVVGDEERRRDRHECIGEAGVKHGQDVHCHPHVIHYLVDGEAQETTKHILTPTDIMDKAKVDPKTHYLIRLIGEKKQESYQDRPEAKSTCTRACVSSRPPLARRLFLDVRREDFIADLRAIGFEVSERTVEQTRNFVIFPWMVPVGRMAGTRIMLGFEVNGMNPPGGPHVSPHLLPIRQTAGQHPFDGVHPSPPRQRVAVLEPAL